MIVTAEGPLADAPAAVTAAPRRNSRAPGRRLRRTFFFLWKFYAGVMLCLTLGGAIFVVGWTYRLVQRSVLRSWWRRSGRILRGESFVDFVHDRGSNEPRAQWPNWILGHGCRDLLARRSEFTFATFSGRLGRELFRSLWLNLRIGVQGIFNTFLLTAPAGVLMLFSWYDGWNNSFSKGYEQAVVGPLTGALGIILFIVAMLYVPLAQARQAATGEWRAFHHYRLNWRLARRQWAAGVFIAGCYSLFTIPVAAERVLPMFLPQIHPSLASLTNEQAAKVLGTYFFWGSFVLFPLYVALRLMAGRIYATALLAAVKSGAVAPDELTTWEQTELGRLGFVPDVPVVRRHPLVRVAARTSVLSMQGAAMAAAVVLWFTAIAQTYVAQFLNYLPLSGWLNQPLVQLPSVRFIPPHLK